MFFLIDEMIYCTMWYVVYLLLTAYKNTYTGIFNIETSLENSFTFPNKPLGDATDMYRYRQG